MERTVSEKLPDVLDFGQCLNLRWVLLKNFPERPGVYVIYHRRRPTVPIYIGSTINLRHRCSAHVRWLRAQRLPSTCLQMAWFPVDDANARFSLEIAMILKYQPRLNTMYKKPLKKNVAFNKSAN